MNSIRSASQRRHFAVMTILTASFLMAGAVAGPAQTVPNRTLVGYWHNWPFSPNNLTLASLPAEYDVINVSFAIPATPFGANMTFAPDPTLYPSPTAFLGDVQSLQASGKKVLISIGGATGPVHLNNASDVATFVASMLSIINAWGFDGIDIDLEGGSLLLDAGDADFSNPSTPKVVNLISAVTQLLAMLPADFMLTAAPETATLQGAASAYAGVWGAYLPVVHALRSHLDWVQTQHYNTGSMLGRNGQLYNPGTADFHVAMADMLISGFNVPAAGMSFPPLAARQVAIGLPASNQAAGSGFTPAAIVHAALDHLYLGLSTAGSGYALGNPDGYPDLRGLMTWSINWDVNAGSSFSLPHRAYLDGINLAADAASVSYNAGGTVGFSLHAGIGHAGRPYYLIPSVSGSFPGTALPGGTTLPINLDAASFLPFEAATAAFFPAFAGTLDGLGNASASMIVPPLAGNAVASAQFAFALAFPFDFASPAIEVDVLP